MMETVICPPWTAAAAAVVALPPGRTGFGPSSAKKLAFTSPSSPFFPLSSAYSPSRPPLSTSFPRSLRARAGAAISAVVQDAGATALCLAGAYSLVSAFDLLAQRKLIEKNLSRKAVHVLSGLLYMSSWPIFSSSMEARYYAAVVPLLNCIRLVVYGFRFVTDEGLIKSVTREGKPEELLRGPLYYVLVLLLCVLVFWRDSPVGIVSLSMMCGGDGFADILGRIFGSRKLPHNPHKSWTGSISMFILGFLISIGMLYYFSKFGYIQFELEQTAKRVALIAFVSTLVESLPISGVIDDNISVPLTSMIMGLLLFQHI